jgi:hypothetical protein
MESTRCILLVGALACCQLLGCGAGPGKNDSVKRAGASSSNETSSSISGSDVLLPEFRALDLNHDGYLSKDEIGRYPRAMVGQFEAADMNKDGRLDYEEFKVLHANTSEDRRLGSK